MPRSQLMNSGHSTDTRITSTAC